MTAEYKSGEILCRYLCGCTRFLLGDRSGGQRDRLHVERFLGGVQSVLVQGLLQAGDGDRQT